MKGNENELGQKSIALQTLRCSKRSIGEGENVEKITKVQ
jgi:hypothetical protein